MLGKVRDTLFFSEYVCYMEGVQITVGAEDILFFKAFN